MAALPELEVLDTNPDDLGRRVEAAVRREAKRVVVAGGDGTIAHAAGALAGTSTSLGIVPAGTLNHLAKDLDLPLDLADAARLAASGRTAMVDIGRANARVFVSTSSVGAYVQFVRQRERLEHRLGYWLASLVAAVRLFARLPLYSVELEVAGRHHRYLTPLVFIGVGERELRLPKLGGRVENGKRGLHVIIVRGRTRARILALALAAAARGLRAIARGPDVDAFLVERCMIRVPTSIARLSLDGEIIETETPIEYTLEREALHVVVSSA
jgi:diacylglycerol kinase family enzyme